MGSRQICAAIGACRACAVGRWILPCRWSFAMLILESGSRHALPNHCRIVALLAIQLPFRSLIFAAVIGIVGFRI
jgi:hypothetical protein